MAGTDRSETGRTDPGYQRHCIRPDCTAAFSALDAEDGVVSVAGWLVIGRAVYGYVCSEHSGPVADGSHRPLWGRDPDDDVVKSIDCACGWAWSPLPAMVTVQHEYQDQWIAHLMAVAPLPGNAGNEPAVRVAAP